jgi:hypothetical protein
MTTTSRRPKPSSLDPDRETEHGAVIRSERGRATGRAGRSVGLESSCETDR